MEIRPFEPSDSGEVVLLWQRCGLTRPWNDPYLDIKRKLGMQASWFLLGEMEGQIVASAMFGYDGHRGWINYLAVDPDQQRHGLGREMVEHGESLLVQAGCPKLNLQIRADNDQAIGFYQSLGYAQDHVVSFGKRLISDRPAEPRDV